MRRRPKISRTWVREDHAGATPVEFPLADLQGAADGPTVAIIAGMHAGECAGILAAQQLIERLTRTPMSGRVLVIPIVSIRSFYTRNMQLSAVDQHEVHYLWPGNPTGSYSEHLVDLLFRTVRGANALVDLHAGEFTQELTPYVAVPWERDDDLYRRSLELARCFAVPFVDQRDVLTTKLALPRALFREGIPNVWTEIGHNGLPGRREIRLQFEGCVGVLRHLGVIPGAAKLHPARVVGPQHWSVAGTRTGLWLPAIRAGENVKSGQVLGRMVDEFGASLETFNAPGDGIVEYVCTSPAIDSERRPHDNSWHQLLVQLAADPAR